MNEPLSNKILERLEVDKITSLPRWRFWLLRWALGSLAVLSVMSGGLAVGAILFLLTDYREHGLPAIPHDIKEFFLIVPYVWIIVFVLFLAITRIAFKHTRRGYQYRRRTLISVNLLLSLILGAILYLIGIGQMTHQLLNEVNLYNRVTYDAEDAWGRPVGGRLAGQIISIKGPNDFVVMDFGGNVWQVHLASTTSGLFTPKASSTVRLFGLLESSSSSTVFIANSIYEWE